MLFSSLLSLPCLPLSLPCLPLSLLPLDLSIWQFLKLQQGETLPTYLESIKEQFEQFEKYLTGKTWFAGSEKVSHVFVLHDWISLINLLDNNYDSQR